MGRITIGILGPFRVTVDGEERLITARKQRALLGLLAIRRRSRDELIAQLWSDMDEERGRDNLRHALYRVRVALGEDVFVSSGDDVALGPLSVDARDLEDALARGDDDGLDRAQALWRGELCPELEGTEAEAERVRLRGLAASAAERLAECRLATDPRRATEAARRATEIDPYREEAQRLLLRALAAMGDLAGAGAHYRRLTALLREELGVEPSPETRAVYAALSRVAPPSGAATVKRPSLEPPAELIGRRAEYGRAMQIVSDAIDGRGGSALLVGEAGAGKSRLLDEIASVAERHGLLVLRGRAASAEGELPFQLWLDALRDHASEAAALPAPWPAVLAALLPEAGEAERAVSSAPELRRTRLFEGVARLLARLADARPTLLALDDLHHADPDSLQLFHYVVRTSRGRRLALLGATRPASPALETLEPLAARGELVRVELGPLAAQAIGELLAGFGVRAEDVDWLGSRVSGWTGGNPFFALEAIRVLVDQGRLRRDGAAWAWSGDIPADDEPLAPELPADVRQTILSRLGALPQRTQRVLDLAATIGTAARLDLLAMVAGRDELAIADDLAPALAASLVREPRDAPLGGIAFSHELIRDATYQRIPLVIRTAIHRRVADALERSGGSATAIAVHLTAGGERARAVDHWLAGAREAERRFALDDAVRSYRSACAALAAASPRRPKVLLALGDAEMRRGTIAAGVAAYQEARAAAPAGDGDLRAVLGTRIARAARWYHRDARASELAEAALAHELAQGALAHERTRGERPELAESLLGLAWVRYVDGQAADALEAADEAREVARRLDLPALEAEAIHAGVWSCWLAGDALAGIERDDLVRLVARLGDDERACALYTIAAIALLRRGDFDAGLDAARAGLDLARRIGSLRSQLETGQEVVDLLLANGRYADAAAIAERIRAEVSSLAIDQPDLLGQLVTALAYSGEPARAIALGDEVLAGVTLGSPAPLHLGAASIVVGTYLSIDRAVPPELVDALEPTCLTCHARWLLTAGRHAALGGDIAGAIEIADRLEPMAGIGAGAAAHIRALAHARAGRSADAGAQAAAARAALPGRGSRVLLERFERDLALASKITP